MASASNQTFAVGNCCLKDNSSDSEQSENSSEENLKKKPEVQSLEKISTEKTVRKSRPKSVSKETVRDSSISSVSSQTSTVSYKTQKKREKNKSSETARDSSISSVSSRTSTSSKKAQGKNKSAVKDLEEIILYQEKQSTEVVEGTSSILQTLTPAVKEQPVPHYCQFYDQEQQWNYREPPWNYLNEKNLQLCKKHERERCLYSNILDMYNFCPYAHGSKELEEWKKRFEWRALKTDLAEKPHIMSYIIRLQEIYLKSPEPFLVMSENIPDVQLEMNGEKNVFSTVKKFSHTWTFTVISLKGKLQKVSLLHDKDRLYFTLNSDFDKSNFQLLDGHQCKLEKPINHWRVTVNFNGKMYGSFSQRVVFDFGSRPLLFQDLTADVGTHKELQQLLTIRDKNNFVLWAPENREIISLQRTTNLLNKYKRPVNVEDIVTQGVLTTGLNRHNYVRKMHKLLFMEEFACHQKLSRYNLCADMVVSETIEDVSAHLNPGPGTLFGELPLSELSEDTDIGRMILTSCTSVYIAFSTSGSKVYEVEIVTDVNLNFKGHRRNSIYLVLTTSCIKDFGLSPGVYQKIELQFQLNRQSFCLMHFALDNMDSVDIVFPDPVKNSLSLKTKPTKCSSKFLNKEQLIAVKYILGERANFLCPFILNGAYGTGKTETLAQATMQLLDTQPNAKILICTQCNSSADLFILKHLDEYMKKKKEEKMLLRVYYSGRYVTSVPYEVRKYTLMSPQQNMFLNPEKTDFAHARVVIATLENCHQLIKLQLKGTFTHIFVDEAAQEFESKVLLPLSLATKDTCVVLSGDHHQMGIKIHSAEARRQGLGISITQRLFEYYANHPHQNVNANSPLHTLLVHNYRSVKEISRFISTCFYGILTNQQEQKTISSVSGLKPLQFYAVSGLEAHYDNCPSYYNQKEVIRVVDCVVNISINWPEELGSFDPKYVCIVSSYKDQVILIRKSLRKLSASLSQIVVEQVGNMPGKEFQVIIISTVHTTRFLDISAEKLANYCDETDEFDFFFNKKLLNTAMTRAKYSVIVVGDPVALCAYGKCSTIWRIFINHCSKLCSVKPSEITYDVVRLEVNRLLSARERSVQQAGATWSAGQLQTGINFPTESLSWSLTNTVNNQEIYESEAHDLSVAHGWSDANDWNCPWSQTYSVSPFSKNASETENHEAVGQDQIESKKIDPVDPISKTAFSKTAIAKVVQQVQSERRLLNNPRLEKNPVSKNESSKKLQLLRLSSNVSLCLLHRNDPLKYFLPEYYMNLSEYQRSLLTEVYRLAIGQHQSIILRDLTLFPENQFWTFSIPSIILQDHGKRLEPDIGADGDFLFPPLQNMICVRFSLTSENVKSTRVFHGYICKTDSSGSNVKVILCVTDDANLKLVELQNQNCNIEIHCWTPVYRSMADSILNLGAASPLARNIVSRQLKPVKYSDEIFSIFEENEFAVIASENSYFNLTHLMHWFEYYASILFIRETATKSPILICTPTEVELDNIVDCLQTENLLSKINVVRVAEVSDESKPSCTSPNKIFLHEKLCSFNEQLMEEMNAFAEIYGQSLYEEDFKHQGPTEILSKADVILCACLTTRRSVFRSVSSFIKQMIIFNAHLCPEVEAMIPISYLPIERLGLISSSEPAPDTSIANRLLQSCPHTKLIFK